MDIKIVKKISKQLLESIRYIHDNCKLIHSDIKIDNILFINKSERIENMKSFALIHS